MHTTDTSTATEITSIERNVQYVTVKMHRPGIRINRCWKIVLCFTSQASGITGFCFWDKSRRKALSLLQTGLFIRVAVAPVRMRPSFHHICTGDELGKHCHCCQLSSWNSIFFLDQTFYLCIYSSLSDWAYPPPPLSLPHPKKHSGYKNKADKKSKIWKMLRLA